MEPLACWDELPILCDLQFFQVLGTTRIFSTFRQDMFVDPLLLKSEKSITCTTIILVYVNHDFATSEWKEFY